MCIDFLYLLKGEKENKKRINGFFLYSFCFLCFFTFDDKFSANVIPTKYMLTMFITHVWRNFHSYLLMYYAFCLFIDTCDAIIIIQYDVRIFFVPNISFFSLHFSWFEKIENQWNLINMHYFAASNGSNKINV